VFVLGRIEPVQWRASEMCSEASTAGSP